MMNSPEVPATPEPHAEMMNRTAATIRIALRPNLSARVPAKNAPTAQPNNMEATLNPVPTESDWNANHRPSTVPLITPLSKPNKKPPMVATKLIRMMNDVLPPSVLAAFALPAPAPSRGGSEYFLSIVFLDVGLLLWAASL